MHNDCRVTCENCLVCLERKSIRSQPYKYHSLRAERPFQKVFIDLAGPLPECKEYKYILAMIDSYSKFVLLKPLKSGCSTEIADVIKRKCIAYFGAPEQIHSDQGLNLNSEEIKRLY